MCLKQREAYVGKSEGEGEPTGFEGLLEVEQIAKGEVLEAA